jgi:pimeloyl-ACP methyl ester carboxylesterase
MNTCFLYENGINSIPSTWTFWPNRAIAWTNKNTPFKAQSLEYLAGAITGHFRHKTLAAQFADLLRQYSVQDWDIHIVGHSNGCRIVVEGMQAAGWPKVKSVHLLCGAVDGNFARNGLGFALTTGKIGTVNCYMASADLAMRIEDNMLGRWLFGVRTKDKPLGLTGPQNVTPFLKQNNRVTETWWAGYGHSTCWLDQNFDKTLNLIMKQAG